MPAIAIILISILAAVAYGIVHDQITARVCVEYFTIGHPAVFHTDDPTLLGIGWGIIATWWMGALLGIPLALATRAGTRPKRTPGSLIKPILGLLTVMAASAFLSGLMGWLLAANGTVFLTGRLANAIPPEKHVPFIADLWAHLASYAVGFFGGIVVIAWVWHSRWRAIVGHSRAGGNPEG